MRRLFLLALIFLLGAAALGCGTAQRGKNKDLDRPTTEKKA